MKKYYWVLFHVKKFYWSNVKTCARVSEILCQDVVDIHPLEYQQNMIDKYGSEFPCTPPKGGKSQEIWVLQNWKEITEEEYKRFYDTL